MSANHLVLSKEAQEEMAKPKLRFLSNVYEMSPKVRICSEELAVAVVDTNELVVDNTRVFGIFTPDGESVVKLWARNCSSYVHSAKRGNIIAFNEWGFVAHVFTSWEAFMRPYVNGHITFISGEEIFVPVPRQLQEVPH